MTRRELIKKTALLSGYALSASVVQGILSGCEAEGAGIDWTPDFFSQEQGRWLAEIGETILPASASGPGAKEVFVHQYIDAVVGQCFKPHEKENFQTGLNELNQQATDSYSKAIHEISAEQRHEMLNKLDKTAKAAMEANPPKPGDESYNRDAFYLGLKQLVIAGYFGSEKVANEMLAFDPVPGEFQGCIPYEEVGKAWAI